MRGRPSRGEWRTSGSSKAAFSGPAIRSSSSVVSNLVDRVLEVCRDAGPDSVAPFGWRYQTVAVLDREAAVSPLALSGARIRVADLLPSA